MRTSLRSVACLALLLAGACAEDPPEPAPPVRPTAAATSGAEDPEESAALRAARRDVDRELAALAHTCDEATAAHDEEVARAERRLVGGYLGALAAIVVGRRFSASVTGFETDPGGGQRSPLVARRDAERAERAELLATLAREFETLDGLFRATPDPALWTEVEWRAFHDQVTRTERACRGLAPGVI